ncbi:GNAT family N-acetyltransferase [Marinicella rhabdoformis]|uniref:GNAT family N-acetyltransferase n=1 Tax=Marinicella rhabdoformis TaxID=2580566 RepID=UPI0012AEB82B|nr:GNAT family N-acetyltransferase [Marinicella rhabdoformis]
MKETVQIRTIEPQDNDAVKTLVLDVLAEHGLVGEGYAGVDPEMDDMYGNYQPENCNFFVVELDGQVCGAGGYAPLAGDADQAELRKMYFKSELRGLGLGHELIEKCITEAKSSGYKGMYLETTPAMKVAQALYQKHGFEFITERMGDTGHGGCGVFMYRSFV